MSNGNWVNEVGNQGMMFLFCSVKKKKIGSLFFYGGKPHCQNSGQAVGRRESLYEFLSRPTELKYVLAASWGMGGGSGSARGTHHCFINYQDKCFSTQAQLSG